MMMMKVFNFLFLASFTVCLESPPFKTAYIEQYIDHFNYRDGRTYKQRYLIFDEVFDRKNGSILFYPGNEADIELFWNNTGFLFDIAPMFGSLVVFAEHRYYGVSLPFGESSFDLDNIEYLSIEQILGDFATLIEQLKQDYGDVPLIAIGGSYGGALAAYMRFKYPNMVEGALASSAPIFLTTGLSEKNLFFEDVTKAFSENDNCERLVRTAFVAMDDVYHKGDYKTLTEKFNLCHPISNPADYRHLQLWMRNVFTILAMANYPYNASFLGNFPANPVKYSCDLLNDQTSSGVDILIAFKNMASIVYNDSNTDCFDIYDEFIDCADPTSCGLGNDAKAWDYQVCTDMMILQESNNVTDMFPPISFDTEQRDEYCNRTWGVDTRSGWSAVHFWGKNIHSASNIIFSNGLLDPWRRGGPTNNISNSLISIMIENAAHHLDLRANDSSDPNSVRKARNMEIEIIGKWINDAKARHGSF